MLFQKRWSIGLGTIFSLIVVYFIRTSSFLLRAREGFSDRHLCLMHHLLLPRGHHGAKEQVVDDPLGSAGLLNAADTLRRGLQVVIVGARGETETDRLLARIFAFSLPARALLVIPPGQRLPENHPAHGKGQIEGRATAYVCRGTVCSLPATDTDELAETIRAMRAGP